MVAVGNQSQLIAAATQFGQCAGHACREGYVGAVLPVYGNHFGDSYTGGRRSCQCCMQGLEGIVAVIHYFQQNTGIHSCHGSQCGSHGPAPGYHVVALLVKGIVKVERYQ